ncbi:YgfZ/GcvT domain-containing protein [Thiobacter aerophilum]|uniref:Folate-binding protein YgfZ n=1 Tax=Thiobacter aerophilum TaxID=3121275 RepID=A0ABV0ECC0_9BURK
MNSDWQQFLQSRGAFIENGQVVHFGEPAEDIRRSGSEPILADLSHFALIRFTGEDAQTFLQGQLSNDVRLLNGRNSQWAAYCTPKGRMLATFLLWKDDADGYLMQLPTSLREPVQKRLSMFVLRARVKISDASDEWVRLGVAGPGAAQIVEAQFESVPGAAHELLATTAGSVLRLAGECFELLCAPEQAPKLWTALAAHCRPVGSSRWDWHLIRAGIPVVLPQTQEEFVPQMANFELVGGVNFKKGCYPGQEIVARTQYLGKLKRRMYLAHLDSEQAPMPGDPLYSADMQEQASGMVVNAAPAPEGGYDLLAVIQTSSAASEPIHWKSLDGPVLHLLKLPYPISA